MQQIDIKLNDNISFFTPSAGNFKILYDSINHDNIDSSNSYDFNTGIYPIESYGDYLRNLDNSKNNFYGNYTNVGYIHEKNNVNKGIFFFEFNVLNHSNPYYSVNEIRVIDTSDPNDEVTMITITPVGEIITDTNGKQSSIFLDGLTKIKISFGLKTHEEYTNFLIDIHKQVSYIQHENMKYKYLPLENKYLNEMHGIDTLNHMNFRLKRFNDINSYHSNGIKYGV